MELYAFLWYSIYATCHCVLSDVRRACAGQFNSLTHTHTLKERGRGGECVRTMVGEARCHVAVNRIGNQELDREQSAIFQVVYGYSYH